MTEFGCSSSSTCRKSFFYHLPPEPVPRGGVSAPKSDFRLSKIVFFFPSSSRACALWRGKSFKSDFACRKSFFYNLPPEPVPCGGVSAPKSDFRWLKIVFLPTSSRAAACEGIRAPKIKVRFPKIVLYLSVSLSLALSISFSLSFSLFSYVCQSVYIFRRSHDGISAVS